MDSGPRTGVTEGVSLSDLGLIERVGPQTRAMVRGSRTLVDRFWREGLEITKSEAE